MAEYFRDDEHRNVLLLIDNIFRFIQAGMEVSGLMGRCRRAWLSTHDGHRVVDAGGAHRQHRCGAITSIQAYMCRRMI